MNKKYLGKAAGLAFGTCLALVNAGCMSPYVGNRTNIDLRRSNGHTDVRLSGRNNGNLYHLFSGKRGSSLYLRGSNGSRVSISSRKSGGVFCPTSGRPQFGF
ncbi:hypothetical protein CMI41_02525 [Candidatus Pacearchaeota archaeon]|jgi:hypothetical protein|nr:hypothetical protein [Candidatus Pacearchaeota archaeon]|tara:strand:- start:1888 stop:2193 length:306 start_codon:yes stop_codon:yes gene_type:complete